MKMKVLDCALLGLFSGVASSAWAPALADTPAMASTRCNETGCSHPDGLLFRLQSRGEREPVTSGTPPRASDAALQPDRRATIELLHTGAPVPGAVPGKATAVGKFSVSLPDGGVIWATEDPTLGLPELSVSAPALVAFDAGRITQPVQVFVRSNYPGFIQRYELSFYRALDTARVEPLATVAVPVAAVSRAEWNGSMATRQPMRAGDELFYVLRAWGADGSFDETEPQSLWLARPDEVERGETLLRNGVEKRLGSALSAQQAQSQRLIDNVFTSNSLRLQNIPIRGSRVRIQGRNLPADHTLLINGNPYPVDLERKFVAEFLEPVGTHRFDLALKDPQDRRVLAQTLDIDVTGRYFFGVGMADLTVFQNKASGPGQGLALNGRTEDILTNGRLAFYGKAKFEGRYLVTAQADTQERDIRDLFSGFGRADPRDVFRRLDPNAYYLTYGDDSTTYRDVDTQGRFYLRTDWDKNQALWGNYATGINSTAYAQYVRSLYGAALNWRSSATTSRGEALSQVRAFASQAQTAPGHSEFVGTGGSLYYLRHTDLLPGSEVIVVELRDTATGRIERRTVLQRGTDYEINELQGRILLSRPLSQIGAASTGITRDAPLAGQQQVLVADYEWIPAGFAADQITAGVRARHWVNDHLAIGGTRVQERRAGDNYNLQGADLTLQAGRGTFLKLERSQTQATSAPVHVSSNGGFSFLQPNAVAGPREGAATAVEAQANLRELGLTERAWNLGGWWRRVDAGYSVARNDAGQAVQEVGVQVQGAITDNVSALALRSRAERGAESLEQLQLTLEWRLSERATVTSEVRRVNEQRSDVQAEGTLGALQATLRLTPQLELRGVAQTTLDNDSGRYADNDAYTVGARYRVNDGASVGAELTTGDRGNAAQVSAEVRLSPEHTVYGSYTGLQGGSMPYDPLFNPRQPGGLAIGQRWRVSERANLFNESQYLKEPQRSGLAHTFGMDFYPGLGWNLGFTLQDGELRGDAGAVQRRAASLSGGRTSPDTEWRSKLEWREDSGAEQRTQWVTTHRLNHRLDESWRLSTRFNYADTQDALNPLASARFVEAGAGLAWRPFNDSRYALLGRYTYLSDLATLGQAGGAAYDQKSHIVALEGTYRWDRQWAYGAKLAHREGQARFGRGSGPWFDSATTFAAAQLRYELPAQWQAMAEYRVLAVKNGGTRSGWLVGVDRDIAPSLRLGVGYNFTSFSDDLTRLDYRYRGFFINLVGSY